MRQNKIMASALLLLGIGVAVSSVLGPLGLNIIRHHVSDGMESQAIGSDLVSLVLVAPLAIAAGVLWWRGSRLAPHLAIGPAIYASYMFFQYITAPEYLRYDGNSESYFPLFYTIVLLGLGIAAVAWSSVDAREFPMPERGTRLTTAWVLIGVGGLLGLAWIKSIVDVVNGSPPAEYLEHPAAFWLVRTMDLSIVIPAALATGIGMLRRRPVAIKAAGVVTAGITLLAASVGSMALVMVVRDDPAAEALFAAILVPAAVALAILTCALWRQMLAAEPATPVPQAAAEAGRQRTIRTTTAETTKGDDYESTRSGREPARQHP